MLKRMRVAVIAAIRAFRTSLLQEAPQTVHHPRPVWDNGTNYDVPTVLRRSSMQ